MSCTRNHESEVINSIKGTEPELKVYAEDRTLHFPDLLIEFTRNELFIYVFIIIAAIGISHNVTVTLSLAFFFVLAILLTRTMHKERTDKITDEYEELDYRLGILAGLAGGQEHVDHFAHDPNVIDLYYNIREYYDYNNDAFVKSMRNVNTLLRILTDSENCLVDGCYRNLSIARDKYKNALNHLHSILFNIPSVDGRLLNTKQRKAISQLQLILIRHLEAIRKNCPHDKYPYENWFLTGMSEPKEQYSESVLVPETAFEYY